MLVNGCFTSESSVPDTLCRIGEQRHHLPRLEGTGRHTHVGAPHSQGLPWGFPWVPGSLEGDHSCSLEVYLCLHFSNIHPVTSMTKVPSLSRSSDSDFNISFPDSYVELPHLLDDNHMNIWLNHVETWLHMECECVNSSDIITASPFPRLKSLQCFPFPYLPLSLFHPPFLSPSSPSSLTHSFTPHFLSPSLQKGLPGPFMLHDGSSYPCGSFPHPISTILYFPPDRPAPLEAFTQTRILCL